MKTLIKSNRIIALIFLLSNITLNVSYAGVIISVNNTFNYQGELIDNGSPANGDYDITIQGYDALLGGSSWGGLSTHLNVTVINGLFTIDGVDLGEGTFDGLELYLEISIRLGGGDPTYTALEPRQKLSSVPYATALTKGNASEGQVYTFSSGKWQAATNDHFSGSFGDLNSVPADIADGDDDTTYFAGVGISISGTTINNSIISLDDLSDTTLDSQFNNLSIASTLPNNTGTSNVAIGASTLNENIDGSANIAIGSNSLSSNISGNNNIAIGLSALSNNTSSNNTAVGYTAGSVGSGEGNVYLGYSAGKFSNQSNKLFIENSSSSSPLIGGDFSTDEVVINGKLGIGVSSPDEKIHVKGNSFEEIKVETTESGATASVVLKTNAGNFDHLVIEKFGPTSPTTSAGIPLAGVSRISAGASAGALMLQVIPSDPMYFVTSNVLQMTLESDGDLKLEKKLTAPDTDNTDMKAYIYASIQSNGNISSFGASSGGFTIEPGTIGRYTVTFNSPPGSYNYTVMTSMRNFEIGFITVLNGMTGFDVRTYDTSGILANKPFNFVVFKQ